MEIKKKKRIKILFIDILTADSILRKIISSKVYNNGSYAESVRRACGLKKKEWQAIDGSKGRFPTDLFGFNGIIIGGSTEDPVQGNEKPWIKRNYKFIQKAIKQKVPILGICGGLQFVVRALGGKIIFNPRGREFGSIEIILTKEGQKDPLFKGLLKRTVFQSVHKCMAKKLLSGWKLLAFSPNYTNQAIAAGPKIRLVQFHLELTKKQVQAIARLRKKILLREGFVKNEADFKKFVSSIQNTEKTGKKVLKNFINYFVRSGA